LDALQEDVFVIMPNPSVGDPVVAGRNRGTFDVELLDITGKILWKGKDVSGGESYFSVPTLGLSPGTYFIRINDQNFVYSLRFLKQ
jgi:hypothetical protein